MYRGLFDYNIALFSAKTSLLLPDSGVIVDSSGLGLGVLANLPEHIHNEADSQYDVSDCGTLRSVCLECSQTLSQSRPQLTRCGVQDSLLEGRATVWAIH